MELQKILDILEQEGVTSASMLAAKASISIEDAEFAMNYWIKKGKVKKKELCKTCHFNCKNCGSKKA